MSSPAVKTALYGSSALGSARSSRAGNSAASDEGDGSAWAADLTADDAGKAPTVHRQRPGPAARAARQSHAPEACCSAEAKWKMKRLRPPFPSPASAPLSNAATPFSPEGESASSTASSSRWAWM